jgi:hypothetical protein
VFDSTQPQHSFIEHYWIRFKVNPSTGIFSVKDDVLANKPAGSIIEFGPFHYYLDLIEVRTDPYGRDYVNMRPEVEYVRIDSRKRLSENREKS